MPTNHRTPISIGLAAVAIIVLLSLSHGCKARQGPSSARGTAEGTASLSEFLTPFRGKVLVLLLGRDGCPGTAKATKALDTWVPAKPANVVVLRLDVPLPNEKLRLDGPWDHPYPRRLDECRRIASELDFFYYPTLYVFDREGELRFTGGWDAARIDAMTREILAETPGWPKKIYTLPMPAPGGIAPAIAAVDGAGKPVSIAALRGERATLLVFAKTSCPFTVEALPAVKSIADEFRKDGVAVVIVNNGEAAQASRDVYDHLTPGVPIAWDPSGKTDTAYGVDTTPFFFLLDKEDRIVRRRSLTPAAAMGAINALLGRGAERPRFNPTEAG